jgi:hypothetical protein
MVVSSLKKAIAMSFLRLSRHRPKDPAITSPFDTAERRPTPKVEQVETPLERMSPEERTSYIEYLRSSVKAQRDAEVRGHENYSR